MKNENNIAFKYTYCKNEKGWFSGVCYNDLIKNNVKKHKRWCCNEQSQCYNFIKQGKGISENEFVCYESEFLSKNEFIAYSGVEKNNTGIPIARNCKNKLAIITTRELNQKEDERYIIAIFVVSEWKRLGDKNCGNVKGCKDLGVVFSKENAKNFKFWNYYKNQNSDKKIWGCRMHRYFDDKVAEKLLADIYKTTNDEKVKRIKEEYFKTIK